MSKVVERAVNTRPFSLPLCFGLGGKVKRDLPGCFRKSNRQFSARIVITEQDIGNSSAALRSGKPGFDDAGHILVHPVDAHRTAINQHYDDGFAGGVDRLHQLQLMTRQIEARA